MWTVQITHFQFTSLQAVYCALNKLLAISLHDYMYVKVVTNGDKPIDDYHQLCVVFSSMESFSILQHIVLVFWPYT